MSMLQIEDGESAPEIETAAYTPGELVMQGEADYQIGDIVAFYDGEIGRDEKNIDTYNGGSFDGYVLFAQVIGAETKDGTTRITFGYASPEDYLADINVHMTEEANLEDQLSEESIQAISSRISDEVSSNEELKAQMLVAVMSSKETQKMMDDLYGEGVYSLAGMSARLTPGRPSVSVSVSGSSVTAEISVSATVTVSKDGRTLLTVTPKLAFTQELSVSLDTNAGKVWIDMAVSIRSMSRIALTILATSGGDVSVLEEAKDTLTDLIKPEGIAEEYEYEEYDSKVSDLMDTMASIASTSLVYNDLFDVPLLKLRFSFYGIVTVGFDVNFVGQIGVLATFGVEIVVRSGEKIGFNFNFLKFKGSSYTQKLESSVTNNIYLIGKIGVRLGIRLTLSVTLCGIASASITGSLYAYAELTGIFLNTLNMLTGASSRLGALRFEVGIDVEVSLSLKVRLIFKTIGKTWTVYEGRWPLWSTSTSSKISYMNGEKLDEMWEKGLQNADNKSVFGFAYIPMKTWELMKGRCLENQLMFGKLPGIGGETSIKIENLNVNGEDVAEGDPKNELFHVGDTAKGENAGFIYMDETVAAEQECKDVELDVVLTYENKSGSALIKKQVQRFHLKKKCDVASTVQNVKVVLYDWCAHNWGIPAAEWDQAQVL